MAINVTYTVYIHIDPNDKRYVGITKRNLEDRWNDGFGYATNKDTRFFDAIREIGWENFKHEIVASNLTKLEAEILEAELIEKYKTTNPEYGYNIVKVNKRKDENKSWIGYIRATPELGDKLQLIADKELRSVNNLMTYILTKYVEEYELNHKL